MNNEERDKIISESYADLIIEYNGDQSKLDQYKLYKGQAVQLINREYAIVHIPVERITKEALTEFSISAMPNCFSLVSDGVIPPDQMEPRGVSSISVKGQSSLIGYIDTGVDYTNPIFRYADNSSKIISIWDQTIASDTQYPKDFFYGTEFTQEEINQALKSNEPLTVVPSTDENGHGTILAAATYESYIDVKVYEEVTPEPEYIIVKLKPAKRYLKEFFCIQNDTLCYQENDIMLGIKYLISVARQQNRPLSICIALGTQLGSHDDLSNLNSYLSSVANQIGNAIVVAAGNEGNTSSHYYNEVDEKKGFDLVELHVAENEYGFSLEIWGDAPNIFTIDITAPNGDQIPRIPIKLGGNRTFSYLFGETIVHIDYILVESQTGDQLIFMRFRKPLAGVWKFRVFAKGDLPLSYHIWLPGNGFISKDTFFSDANPYTTISNPGNATGPITVTSYNQVENKVHDYASRGYTRSNVIKPELAVPSLNHYNSNNNNVSSLSSSTSFSAAYTTGITAMILEWGIIRRNYLNMNSFEIKKLLVRSASRSPNTNYPNKELGYGVLNNDRTFQNLHNPL